jgi:hypothetical protein
MATRSTMEGPSASGVGSLKVDGGHRRLNREARRTQGGAPASLALYCLLAPSGRTAAAMGGAGMADGKGGVRNGDSNRRENS